MIHLTPEPECAPIARPLLIFLVVLPLSLAGFLAGPPFAWAAVVALSIAASLLWRALERFAHARRRRLPLPCTPGDGLVVDLPVKLRGPITLVLRCVREANGSGAVARSVLWTDEVVVPEPTSVRLQLPASPQGAAQLELDVRASGFAARYPLPSHVVAAEAQPAAPVVEGE